MQSTLKLKFIERRNLKSKAVIPFFLGINKYKTIRINSASRSYYL